MKARALKLSSWDTLSPLPVVTKVYKNWCRDDIHIRKWSLKSLDKDGTLDSCSPFWTPPPISISPSRSLRPLGPSLSTKWLVFQSLSVSHLLLASFISSHSFPTSSPSSQVLMNPNIGWVMSSGRLLKVARPLRATIRRLSEWRTAIRSLQTTQN